ncbi:AMP-binding protein [Seohaeicola zhoushanensis]|uniref:Acyl-CoA synthetase n=1 Tax=Seohaeicola zhoushanensis TaxID=1569283 RepID=A0A8J3GYR6_9RHOB|nr:AMP-binding protein [Seohaeicola zhoushanensis]GHF52511.1 acyl-CoA synthetase [Seohaeicola zhoushanensis]
MTISGIADLEQLEARGFEAVFPHSTPWDLLKHSAARAPDATAIRFLRDAGDPAADRIVSYGDLLRDSMGAARLFRGLGVVPGRSVALMAQHTPSAHVALWGGQIAGHVCPINPLLKPAHIAGLLKAAGAAVVVITGVNDEIDYWSNLVPALRAEGVTLPILACDGDADCPGADGIFEDLVAGNLAGPEIAPEGDEHALAAYYHTGGTTGAPKLVRHSRLNEAHVARSCALLHDLAPQDVVVNGFPLFHVAGAFVYGLSTLSAGGTLLIPGRLGMRNQTFMRSIWQQVERHGITIVGAVPTVLAALNGIPVNADISTLRWFLTGGSPLPTELAEATESKTGRGVRNILGMTECAGAIAVEPVHGPRTPLSCGLRMPFSEVAILGETAGDADPDKRLGADQTGIIALRGPNVSAGYSDPQRNAGTFLPGGWLVSGDIGKLDTAGRLYVTGRAKDIIIRGAHNIDPQMIEDALLAHPEVENAAAVGMPDAYAGELPVAFVTLRSGAQADGSALIAFLRERIDDPVALPKRIGVLEALPLTPVGKIFKPTLRREAILWAIAAAAEEAGIDASVVDIEVSESLDTSVEVPAATLDAMKQALTGMPLALTITGRE